MTDKTITITMPLVPLQGLIKTLAAIEYALENGEPLPAQIERVPLYDCVSLGLSGLINTLLEAGYPVE